ncbi:MAG: response regulator [Terrimicrobiaceae bacterium]|nr:response regulator [Terrimicrobiaceae bacterium]
MKPPGNSVLVVEDFDPDFELVCRRLRAVAPTLQVSRLHDLDEIARWLDHPEPPPSLVLLDLSLRDGDASRLLADFRRALQKVPLVVWSASPDPDVPRRCLASGADRFIRKVADGNAVAKQLDFLIARWVLAPAD